MVPGGATWGPPPPKERKAEYGAGFVLRSWRYSWSASGAPFLTCTAAPTCGI